MNASKQQNNHRSWLTKPSTWLVGISLPLIALLSGFVAQEWSAKSTFQGKIEELRRQGKPVDSASMNLSFVSSTSSENTVAWNEAAYAASGWAATMGHDLPYFGEKEVPASAFTGGDWPEAVRVEEFLSQMEPLLQRIHDVADKTTGPVWQPVHFDGWGTLLGSIQVARSISRLLALEFDYAVYSKDRQRAIKSIKSAFAVVRAYQWDTFLVQELVSIAQLSICHASIAKSLQSDIWTVDDLNELKNLVGSPIDMASLWPKMFEFELAASLTSLQSNSDLGLDNRGLGRFVSNVAKLPSSQLRFLNEMQQIGSLGQNDLVQLYNAAVSFDQQNLGMLSQMFAPSVQQFARAQVNREESRRALLAAIALKQYKLTHGSYPIKLDAVLGDPTIEVTRAVLEGVDQSPLGYKLDGSVAYLWNTRLSSGFSKITDQLPDFDSDTGYAQNHAGSVITLR